MLILLSPSKTQDFETKPPASAHTVPALIDDSRLLMEQLAKLSQKQIEKLMQVSGKIAALNQARYRSFDLPFTPRNAKQAVFAFQGDVYDGLKVEGFDEKALAFAQDRLRILSGLYGLLRPLDLIQPYRLEMKIRLKNPRGKDLYAFWGDRIAQEINAFDPKVVVNLASEEYFKAVHSEKLNARVITPQFKEKKPSGYKMIMLFAKQARGAMARYIISRQITEPDALQFFAEDGYRLNVALSKPDTPVYTRG